MPDISFPKAIGNFVSFLLNLTSEIISFKNTFSLLELGISIPIVFLPGIVATLVETELVFLAISSDKLMILDNNDSLYISVDIINCSDKIDFSISDLKRKDEDGLKTKLRLSRIH